jgi:hypothetical protein
VVLGAMPTSNATPIKTTDQPDLADLCKSNIHAATVSRRAESAIWSISHLASRAPVVARLWHSVTGSGGLRWVSV